MLVLRASITVLRVGDIATQQKCTISEVTCGINNGFRIPGKRQPTLYHLEAFYEHDITKVVHSKIKQGKNEKKISTRESGGPFSWNLQSRRERQVVQNAITVRNEQIEI